MKTGVRIEVHTQSSLIAPHFSNAIAGRFWPILRAPLYEQRLNEGRRKLCKWRHLAKIAAQ